MAGERSVAIASAEITGQGLGLGLGLDLLDEVAVSLIPVLLGSGKSYFGGLTRYPVTLDDPIVIPGTRATHLRYRVQKRAASV